MKHTINPVFRSLNRPLTVLGIERKLFFFLLTVAFALFNLTGALAPAVILFVALWTGARLAWNKDPRLIRILMNSRRFKTRYDPAKLSPTGDDKGTSNHGVAQIAL